MRRMFNEGKFWERTQSGDLTAVVERPRHPSLPLAKEPFCTESQQVSYYDANGNEVARVHQYKRTDGTIGLSGKPDPKRLFQDGTIYRLEKATKRKPPPTH
jgi:hypothetical protein